MGATKPVCQLGPRWLINHLSSKSALAPLTGQDRIALSAFFHLLELYAIGDDDGRSCALIGMRAAVGAMQPKCRWLAKEGIPHVLDWGDEDRVWTEIGDEQPAARRDEAQDEPNVCPGCHAVNAACAPGCIDAEIARKREEPENDLEMQDRMLEEEDEEDGDLEDQLDRAVAAGDREDAEARKR